MEKMTSWHDTNLRWFILVLIGVYPLVQFLIGEYPALLGEQIKSYFEVSQAEINYLLSFRSFPNMIMSLIGGLIIDTFGVRRSYVFFGSIVIIGQLLCFMSVILNSFIVMVIGRFIFGLFESSGFVAESYYINKWFKGKENSLAFGIDTGICRLGSIAAAIIYPYLYTTSNNDLSQCLLMCLYIAILSFIIIVILTQIDRCSDLRDKTSDQKLDSIDLRQIKQFSLEFYVTLISCVTCYAVFFIFGYNSVEMFKHIYKLDQKTANTLFSIPYYLSAILSPIVGHYIDKKGKNIEILLIASFCQLLTTTIFYLMPECDTSCVAFPMIGSILNGLFFGTYYAVMWPHIPLIVPSHMVGTGFGLTFACINIEITSFSFIVASMLQIENYQNYQQMNQLMLFLSLVGFIPLVYLFQYHRTQYHKNIHAQTDDNLSTNQIELIVKSKPT
ncbi:unnamed protein product [Paramecium pentaurelia]|uniref:Major facilitator superfamily (MFS) profile domain-containing protein n=1 Tax=Paramecium pentaurelia TaxID=43138 RepID=A0A8S1V1Y3_9CILI|nr:unnamed protein product [Paramecium pentaurelia]